MTALKRTLLASVLLSVAVSGRAQGASEPPMVGDPLVFLQNDVLNCGVRIQFSKAGNQPGQRILAMSATIVLDPQHKAVVVSFSAYDYLFKANIEETMASNRTRPVQTGWIRSDGQGPTKPQDGMTQPLEPVDGVIYPTSDLGDLAILVALLDGKPIEVGIRLSGTNGDVVQSGTVVMASPDKLKVKSCLDVAMGTLNK